MKYRIIATITAMLMLSALFFGCGTDDDPAWWTEETSATTTTEEPTTEPEADCSYICECEDPENCDYECFCGLDIDNDNDNDHGSDDILQLIPPSTTTTRPITETPTTTATTTTTRTTAPTTPTTPPAGVIPITGVTFTGSSAAPYTLNAGQAQQQLSFAVEPTNATQTVQFRSSNSSVLQVSATGQLRPQSGGTATVEAFVGHTVFATVSVTVLPVVVVHAAAASVAVGSTLTLSARDFNGTTHPAANVTWSSNAPNIAAVDPVTGVVTGVSPSPAQTRVTITATLQHASGAITGSTSILVNAAP